MRGAVRSGLRLLQRPRLRVVLAVLLIATAWAAPRAVALRGVHMVGILGYDDMAEHLLFLDNLTKQSTLERAPGSSARAVQRRKLQWPEGMFQVARIPATIFGPASIWTTQLTNGLFTALLALAVAGLGRALGGRTATLAALLVMLCPALVASSWYFHLDYPLVAMVAMGLLLLLHSDGFSRWSPSLSFAAWSALGVWVKPTYVIYLLAPSVWAAVRGLRRAPRRGRWALRFAAVVGLFMVVMALVYAPDPKELWQTTHMHLVSSKLPGADISAWSVGWLLSQAVFAAVNYPLPLLLLAVPGLVCLHRRGAPPAAQLLGAFIWGGVLLLTLMSNKLERYTQPLYPALCLVSAWWIATWLRGRWRAAVQLGAAAVFAVVLCLAHLYPLPWNPARLLGLKANGVLDPFRYECRMPGPHRLAQLRRLTWDDRCQLGPLVGQVAGQVVAHTAHGGQVGLSVLRGAPWTPRHLRMEQAVLHSVPGLAQVLPAQMLFAPSIGVLRGVQPDVLRTDTLVVFHRPALDARPWLPGRRVVARRRLEVTCEDEGPVPMAITVSVRAAPAQEARP